MKLSVEQYKKLQRFANFLISEDHESIDWVTYIYEYGEMDSPYGPYGQGRPIDGLNSFRDVISILELVMEKTLNNLDFSDHMDCDECTGNGTVNISFYPETLKMGFELEVGITVAHPTVESKTFRELANFRPDIYGDRYDKMKKLNDPNFINEYPELGPELEVNYDGGGDDGYIQDEEYIPTVFTDISYEILNAFYGGWELNEGSQGTILYDFRNKKVSIHHNLFENEGFDVDVHEIDFTN
jgi:hypothetical protein